MENVGKDGEKYFHENREALMRDVTNDVFEE